MIYDVRCNGSASLVVHLGVTPRVHPETALCSYIIGLWGNDLTEAIFEEKADFVTGMAKRPRTYQNGSSEADESTVELNCNNRENIVNSQVKIVYRLKKIFAGKLFKGRDRKALDGFLCHEDLLGSSLFLCPITICKIAWSWKQVHGRELLLSPMNTIDKCELCTAGFCTIFRQSILRTEIESETNSEQDNICSQDELVLHKRCGLLMDLVLSCIGEVSVSNGIKFGVDRLIYIEGVGREHAPFGVSYRIPRSNTDFMRSYRILRNSKKAFKIFDVDSKIISCWSGCCIRFLESIKHDFSSFDQQEHSFKSLLPKSNYWREFLLTPVKGPPFRYET